MKPTLRSFIKDFKVVAVSINTNSFGLHNVIMVARDGEAWQCGANYLNVPKDGDMLSLRFSEKAPGVMDKYPQFPFSCEIPERKPDPPKELLAKFFAEKVN